ncbi:MAG: hypothetical protein PHQ28_00105 [Mycobacterium sp.]|nr:hypothetical protein [Mycobacterium sp.]
MTTRAAIQTARDYTVAIAGRWDRPGFHSSIVAEAQALTQLVDRFLLHDCALPGPAIAVHLRTQLDKFNDEIRRVEQCGHASNLIGACRRLCAVLDDAMRLWAPECPQGRTGAGGRPESEN